MALTQADIRAAVAPYLERRNPATVTADRLVRHCEDWGHDLDPSDLRKLENAIAVLRRVSDPE